MSASWLVTCALAVQLPARAADAFSACAGELGWSPRAADELPVRARLVYWDDRQGRRAAATLTAKIDGTAVKTKQTAVAAAPYRLVVVDIDSDRTGTLEVGWSDGSASATYQVKAGVRYPAHATATVDRFQKLLHHTSVHEAWDAIAIHVDVPATQAHVKLRRDAKATWHELDVPVADHGDGTHALRLGALGCVSNYDPKLFELTVVEIDVELVLPDGKRVHVDHLAHVGIFGANVVAW